MLLHQIIKNLEKAPQTRLEAIMKYRTLMIQVAHWCCSELPDKDQKLVFKELYSLQELKMAPEVRTSNWFC